VIFRPIRWAVGTELPLWVPVCVCTLSLGVLVPARAPAVTPVAAVRDGASYAPAGPFALVGTARRDVATVRRISLRGVAPVASKGFRAPSGQIAGLPLLSGSQARSAALFTSISEGFDPERVVATQSFAADGAGPLTPIEPLRPLGDSGPHPVRLSVDGARTFLTEVSADFASSSVSVREGPGPPVLVGLPAGAALDAVFAGQLVAYSQQVPGEEEEFGPGRVVLARWRTGEVVRSVRVRGGVDALAIDSTGRIVIGEDHGGEILDVLPGRAGTRRLTRSGHDPVLAGSTVIAVRDGHREGDQRLIAISAAGAVRAFGVPATEISRVVADPVHVLWGANGCVLSAFVGEPVRGGVAAGPCPRSQLFFDDELSGRADRHGRVALLLRCVSAAPSGCRGNVRLRGDGGYVATPQARFRIPVGARRLVRVTLGSRARRVLLRGSDAPFEIDAATTDPGGRVSRLFDAVGLHRGELHR